MIEDFLIGSSGEVRFMLTLYGTYSAACDDAYAEKIIANTVTSARNNGAFISTIVAKSPKFIQMPGSPHPRWRAAGLK